MKEMATKFGPFEATVISLQLDCEKDEVEQKAKPEEKFGFEEKVEIEKQSAEREFAANGPKPRTRGRKKRPGSITNQPVAAVEDGG